MWMPAKPRDGFWLDEWDDEIDGPRFAARRLICRGKSAGSPPPAPNPVDVANAQTTSNIQTAQEQQALNDVNQVSPFGSLTFEQTPGTTPAAPGTPSQPGDTTAVTQLSPQEQQIFDQQMALANQLTGAAGNVANQVTTNSETPFSLSGVTPLPTSGDLQGNLQQVQDALYKQQTQYLDPQFQEQQHDLDVSLANQGIPVGSDAWSRAEGDLARQKQAGYSNALDTAIAGGQQAQAQEFAIGQGTQQQEEQNLLLQRQEPINELAAALQGAPALQMPSFGQPAQTGVSPTDVTGAFGLSTGAQQAAYQARAQQAAAGNSATAGAVGTIALGALIF